MLKNRMQTIVSLSFMVMAFSMSIISCDKNIPVEEQIEKEIEVDEEEEEDQERPEACEGYNHVHAVDLGLSVRWACCNVDASAPEEYGGFYAWGETEEKSNYNEYTYEHVTVHRDTTIDGNSTYIQTTMKYAHIGSNISGTRYDVAHVKWGKGWRMPTRNELEELFRECTWEWVMRNGAKGMLFTGPNGNSIFLPAAGYHWGLGHMESEYYDEGSCGVYQSGTLTSPDSGQFAINIYSGMISHGADRRHSGYSIRPVKDC